MVRGDSDMHTVYDLKPGTRFVDLVFSPGMFETSPTAALAWAGLTPDDIVKVPAGSQTGKIFRLIGALQPAGLQ